MRSNYVRSFYLPEHQPMPSSYTLHYQSRFPPHCNQSKFCKCGRDKDRDELSCDLCKQERTDTLIVIRFKTSGLQTMQHPFR